MTEAERLRHVPFLRQQEARDSSFHDLCSPFKHGSGLCSQVLTAYALAAAGKYSSEWLEAAVNSALREGAGKPSKAHVNLMRQRLSHLVAAADARACGAVRDFARALHCCRCARSTGPLVLAALTRPVNTRNALWAP